MSETRLSDVILPAIYLAYMQQKTEEKSRLVGAGVIARDPSLDSLLSGAGLTFNLPSWQDLANDSDNVASDNPATTPTHGKIVAGDEIGVRLYRTKSWATMALVRALIAEDPMAEIGKLTAGFWERRLQTAAIASVQGVFADNAAAPDASEHVQNDLTNSIIGGSYSAGVTDFSAEAFIDTVGLMGDSAEDLGALVCHSTVYNRMDKNNLLDTIRDSEGLPIRIFRGRRVIVDDGVPNPAGAGAAATAAGIYHTWILGQNAFRWGVSFPKNAVATFNDENAGNGSGEEILFNRLNWMIHPTGHQFIGATPPAGGPSNASTSGNLAHAGSWKRVFPERKQIKIARLITRES